MFLNDNKLLRAMAVLGIAITIAASSGCVGIGTPSEPSTSPGDNVKITPEPTLGEQKDIPDPYPKNFEEIQTPVVGKLPADRRLTIDPVNLDGSQIVEMRDSPSGYGLRLMGTMPTACHQLKIEIDEPNLKGEIHASVYAIAEPGQICIQIIAEFDETVPLKTYDPQVHSLYVNGESIGTAQVKSEISPSLQ